VKNAFRIPHKLIEVTQLAQMKAGVSTGTGAISKLTGDLKKTVLKGSHDKEKQVVFLCISLFMHVSLYTPWWPKLSGK
jgi:hypothetical protein